MPVLLIILDGFGEGKAYSGNAVTLAKTPTLNALKKKYPWTRLGASGNAVGIPEGTQGGSEVGHFTIGAGRRVFQSLEAINRSIQDKSFFEKPALVEACERTSRAKSAGAPQRGADYAYARRLPRRYVEAPSLPKAAALHLLGMISDQGVHSDIRHLFALLELAKQQHVEKVYIHAITDGRDVPERSAANFITQIQKKISELGTSKTAKIATIIGRYFAMDRDSNWDRTKKAYDLYTLGRGVRETDPLAAVKNAYNRGIETDYYIDPIILDEHGVIKDKDSVVFWNFRTDRARQLTWAFTGEIDAKNGHRLGFTPEKIVHPYFVCIGPYSETAPVVFPTPVIKNNLGEVISNAGLTQFRIAETEKYAHVTYFLNSQIETPFSGEDRLMINSPKCASYAEKPEMSAHEITDALLPRLAKKNYALIVLNFANCDLVGHSGDLKASIKAVEVVDECIGRIIPVALKNNYTTLITGDHGNVEYKIYEKDGTPCPSHTTNPVPFIVVGDENQKLKISSEVKNPELKNIAPTILKIMGIPKPSEMTGESLV